MRREIRWAALILMLGLLSRRSTAATNCEGVAELHGPVASIVEWRIQDVPAEQAGHLASFPTPKASPRTSRWLPTGAPPGLSKTSPKRRASSWYAPSTRRARPPPARSPRNKMNAANGRRWRTCAGHTAGDPWRCATGSQSAILGSLSPRRARDVSERARGARPRAVCGRHASHVGLRKSKALRGRLTETPPHRFEHMYRPPAQRTRLGLGLFFRDIRVRIR